MFDKLLERVRKTVSPPPPPPPGPRMKVRRVSSPAAAPAAAPPIRYRQSADDPAPIIDDPTMRPDNVDFRREGDGEHIYRVNQPQPKGFPKKYAEYVPIAGTSFRQLDVIAFIRGRNRRLEIRHQVAVPGRDPSLAVYGHWDDWNGGEHEAHLGYIPSEVHAAIGDMPVALTLEGMYQAGLNRTAGLRVDIWQPRPKREKPQQ